MHACIWGIEWYVSAYDRNVVVFVKLGPKIWKNDALSAVSNVKSNDVCGYVVGIDAVGPALEDCCFLFIWLHTSCTKGHPEAITLVRAVHYADHFHEIVASHIAAFICLSAAIFLLILIVLRGINHQLRLDLDWD